MSLNSRLYQYNVTFSPNELSWYSLNAAKLNYATFAFVYGTYRANISYLQLTFRRFLFAQN